MKIFNKATALLIAASFLFSGDVFAVKQIREDRVRIPIKRAVRVPVVKRTETRPVSGRVRSFNRQIDSNKAISVRRNSRQLPVLTNRAERSRLVRTPQVRPRANTALAQTPAAAAPKAARTIVKRQASAPVTPAQTPAAEMPRAVKQQEPSKAVRSIMFNAQELPEDLKRDLYLEFFGAQNSKGLMTPQEVREELWLVQESEKAMRGMTQKTRELYQSKGYGRSNENINVSGRELLNLCPAHLHSHVKSSWTQIQDPVTRFHLTHGLDTPVSIPQVVATNNLNRMQDQETRSAGITQRLREYYKSKGFES